MLVKESIFKKKKRFWKNIISTGIKKKFMMFNKPKHKQKVHKNRESKKVLI